MSLVWLITGCSSGFGLRIVQIALSRGDRVIATARTLSKLQTATAGFVESSKERLRLLQLDVTESEESIRAKIAEAVKFWGQIDVLVNNAGFGVLGFVEEGGSELLKRIFQANVYGVMNMNSAVLPYMRERKTGTIVIIGSRSEWSAEVPVCRGHYAISKAAVRVMGETLATEVMPFGIRVLIVEPGAFRTEGIYTGGYYTDNLISDYDAARKVVQDRVKQIPGKERGDPDKAMQALVDVVHGTGVAAGKKWPTILFLGDDAEADVRNKTKVVIESLEEWKDVTRGVSFT